MALAIVVCLVPMSRLPQAGASDKTEHFIGYLLLSLWFAGIYPRARYWLIALGLLVMGVLIEFAQGAMHYGRQADIHDVYANSTGIVTGLLLCWWGLGGWAQRIESWGEALVALVGKAQVKKS